MSSFVVCVGKLNQTNSHIHKGLSLTLLTCNHILEGLVTNAYTLLAPGTLVVFHFLIKSSLFARLLLLSGFRHKTPSTTSNEISSTL